MGHKWSAFAPEYQARIGPEFAKITGIGWALGLLLCPHPPKRVRSIQGVRANADFPDFHMPDFYKGKTGILELEGDFGYLAGTYLRFNFEFEGEKIQGGVILNVDETFNAQILRCFEDLRNRKNNNVMFLDDPAGKAFIVQLTKELESKLDYSKFPYPLNLFTRHLVKPKV